MPARSAPSSAFMAVMVTLSASVGVSLITLALQPTSRGPLIQAYCAATCVVPKPLSDSDPKTRSWDAVVEVAGGHRVAIRAAGMAGGRIAVRFTPDDIYERVIVPGDYIYPDDIRIREDRRTLYTKAQGFAGGVLGQTRLYAYDLVERRELASVLVDPAALPNNCEMKDQGLVDTAARQSEPDPPDSESSYRTSCEQEAMRRYGTSFTASREAKAVRVPRKVHDVRATYPTLPKGTRVLPGGWLVDILIEPSGQVGGIWVEKSIRFEPPFPAFTQAAVDAIRQWRFEPANVDGRAVPVCMKVSGHVDWE